MLRTMISTAKNQLLPVVWTLLIENRISSMPTDIVKRLYMTIPVLDQKKVKPGDFEAAVAPRFGESESMRHEEPVFRKDGSTFQLVEEGLRVPRRGKASLKHGFVNAVAAAVGVAVGRSVRGLGVPTTFLSTSMSNSDSDQLEECYHFRGWKAICDRSNIYIILSVLQAAYPGQDGETAIGQP